MDEWGLWILSPSRSNGAAKYDSVLDERRVWRLEDGHTVHTRWSVHRIWLFFWKLSLFPAERLWGTVLYKSGITGLSFIPGLLSLRHLRKTMKAQGVTSSSILFSCHMNCFTSHDSWLGSFVSQRRTGRCPPARPTGRVPELCMAPPWGAKQAHRSSAPAWSPGKSRAGMTVALHCGWQRFGVMQCGTFAQSLLSERFPGLSTADNGGPGPLQLGSPLTRGDAHIGSCFKGCTADFSCM